MNRALNHREKNERLANKPKTVLSMQEQATQLLMNKCGILDDKKKPGEADRLNFSVQFTEPLIDKTVEGFRETFGLNELQGGPFAALACEADD